LRPRWCAYLVYMCFCCLAVSVISAYKPPAPAATWNQAIWNKS